jgi:hypothetical protein
MYQTNIPLIMKDHLQLKRDLKKMCSELKNESCTKKVDQLLNLIKLTVREIIAIEEELDLLLDNAFNPNSSIPLLDLITQN